MKILFLFALSVCALNIPVNGDNEAIQVGKRHVQRRQATLASRKKKCTKRKIVPKTTVSAQPFSTTISSTQSPPPTHGIDYINGYNNIPSSVSTFFPATTATYTITNSTATQSQIASSTTTSGSSSITSSSTDTKISYSTSSTSIQVTSSSTSNFSSSVKATSVATSMSSSSSSTSSTSSAPTCSPSQSSSTQQATSTSQASSSSQSLSIITSTSTSSSTPPSTSTSSCTKSSSSSPPASTSTTISTTSTIVASSSAITTSASLDTVSMKSESEFLASETSESSYLASVTSELAAEATAAAKAQQKIESEATSAATSASQYGSYLLTALQNANTWSSNAQAFTTTAQTNDKTCVDLYTEMTNSPSYDTDDSINTKAQTSSTAANNAAASAHDAAVKVSSYVDQANGYLSQIVGFAANAQSAYQSSIVYNSAIALNANTAAQQSLADARANMAIAQAALKLANGYDTDATTYSNDATAKNSMINKKVSSDVAQHGIESQATSAATSASQYGSYLLTALQNANTWSSNAQAFMTTAQTNDQNCIALNYRMNGADEDSQDRFNSEASAESMSANNAAASAHDAAVKVSSYVDQANGYLNQIVAFTASAQSAYQSSIVYNSAIALNANTAAQQSLVDARANVASVQAALTLANGYDTDATTYSTDATAKSDAIKKKLSSDIAQQQGIESQATSAATSASQYGSYLLTALQNANTWSSNAQSFMNTAQSNDQDCIKLYAKMNGASYDSESHIDSHAQALSVSANLAAASAHDAAVKVSGYEDQANGYLNQIAGFAANAQSAYQSSIVYNSAIALNANTAAQQSLVDARANVASAQAALTLANGYDSNALAASNDASAKYDAIDGMFTSDQGNYQSGGAR